MSGFVLPEGTTQHQRNGGDNARINIKVRNAPYEPVDSPELEPELSALRRAVQRESLWK